MIHQHHRPLNHQDVDEDTITADDTIAGFDAVGAVCRSLLVMMLPLGPALSLSLRVCCCCCCRSAMNRHPTPPPLEQVRLLPPLRAQEPRVNGVSTVMMMMQINRYKYY